MKKVNPVGLALGTCRVYRGGCWDDVCRFCRSACRFSFDPAFQDNGVGFRVVALKRSAKNEKAR